MVTADRLFYEQMWGSLQNNWGLCCEGTTLFGNFQASRHNINKLIDVCTNTSSFNKLKWVQGYPHNDIILTDSQFNLLSWLGEKRLNLQHALAQQTCKVWSVLSVLHRGGVLNAIRTPSFPLTWWGTLGNLHYFLSLLFPSASWG